jgi:hypothetical protein
MRCYLGPFPAATVVVAAPQCEQATLTGFGRAVTALGAGANNDTGIAIPMGACGTFLHDTTGGVLITKTPNISETHTCNITCSAAQTFCSCNTCNCSGAGQGYGCFQPYYCVMDPLGPRVLGACTADYECPAGDRCSGGNCAVAGPFCVLASDCDAGFTTCAFRGQGETGLCQ